MLNDNDRLIIVLGMAHSGTTILTYLLKQHPEVVCCTGGEQGWILENDWLPNEQGEPIQQLLDMHPTKRVLLKRPWNEVLHPDWMAGELPNAKYLYCLRPFEDISKSWSKATSFVYDTLRNGGLEYQRDYYRMCLEASLHFQESIFHFKTVQHEEFLAEPSRVITDIAAWLGLSPWEEWDVSQVSTTLNIKDVLRR